MISNFQMNYNKNDDRLDIIKVNNNGRNVVQRKECKYGVEIYYDIEDNPRCITIPEVSVLFGISKEDLFKFASFFY